MSMAGENSQDLFRQARQANRRDSPLGCRDDCHISVVMTNVVARVMMAVIGHMMVMGMMRHVVMMNGGRGRRSDQQRRCDDDGQSREKFTH